MSEKIIKEEKTDKTEKAAKSTKDTKSTKDGSKKIIYKNKPSEKDGKITTKGVIKNKAAEKKQKEPKQKEPKQKEPRQYKKKEASCKVAKTKKPKTKKVVSNIIPLRILTAMSIVFLVLFALLLKPLITVDLSFKKVTVRYELYGGKSSSDVSKKVVFKDGKNVYVNFGAISATLGMHTVGNENEVIFYSDSGDSIELQDNSRFAEINGISVELDGVVFIDGNDIFIPATLLSRYSSGLTVVYNRSIERLTIATVKDEEKSNALGSVYEKFEMTLREITPCTPIDENNIYGENESE